MKKEIILIAILIILTSCEGNYALPNNLICAPTDERAPEMRSSGCESCSEDPVAFQNVANPELYRGADCGNLATNEGGNCIASNFCSKIIDQGDKVAGYEQQTGWCGSGEVCCRISGFLRDFNENCGKQDRGPGALIQKCVPINTCGGIVVPGDDFSCRNDGECCGTDPSGSTPLSIEPLPPVGEKTCEEYVQEYRTQQGIGAQLRGNCQSACATTECTATNGCFAPFENLQYVRYWNQGLDGCQEPNPICCVYQLI